MKGIGSEVYPIDLKGLKDLLWEAGTWIDTEIYEYENKCHKNIAETIFYVNIERET